MILFLTGSYDHSKHTPMTTITGIFLLVLYMAFDSFTSNWQSEIFKSYGISSIQMMCGATLFSSAVGQLFIFFTIEKFGAVIFTIIMTLRQAIAILLSCLIYHHEISALGIFGIIIIFLAIFLRVYCSHRIKILRRKHELLKQRLNV